MKQFKPVLLASICLIFILASCSVQKRVYMPGYHVTWKKSKAKNETNQVAQAGHKHKSTVNNDRVETFKMVSFERTNAENNSVVTASAERNSAAPVLIKTHKTLIQPVSSHKPAETKSVKKETKQLLKKDRKKTNSGAGGKSQVVALLLCIFLGLLGIHRFYLGYTGMGILYLLTVGLFGIGWIIDLILLIIPNGLTPKGKTSYDE